MTGEIPPGIVYIVTSIPSLCTPAFVVYLANNYLLRNALDIHLPGWLACAAYVLSAPVWFTATVFWRDFLIYLRARSKGAVLPPTTDSKLPGAIDVMLAMSKLQKTAYPGEALIKHVENYGNTFNARVLFKNRIVTSEPEYIKIILATDFEGYEKGKVFRKNFNDLLGNGVFNSDGDMWKFHRGMTRPFFSKDRITHFDIFDRHAEDAVSQMKARIRQGFPIDIQDVVSRFTLDSATDFLFGNDVCSLSAGLAYPPGAPIAYSSEAQSHPANIFASAFLNAQAIAASRGRWDSNWPLVHFWEDKLKKELKTVSKFVDPIVENALSLKKAGGGDKVNSDENITLLEHLVQLTDDATIIKDQALNIMIAGRDTTASTLTSMIYILSQHPDVLHRLRQEILDKLGPSKRPTHDDLRELQYLRATINETLRLFPAVPFNVRFSRKDTTWPSTTGGKPWFIPANTRCIYSVFAMHRRTDLWGPDALEFDPDRFLDERVNTYLTPNPFIFLPFNAGPRICLGQQFAYNEISFMMIRLLQSFSEISWAPEACPEALPPVEWAEPGGDGRRQKEKIWLKAHLTMYANNGFWVNMKEAGTA